MRTPQLRRPYDLYGITLRSQWRLPLPQTVRRLEPEVYLFQANASKLPPPCCEVTASTNDGGWYRRLSLPNKSTYLRWAGLFEFQVSADGRRIAGRPLNGAHGRVLQNYLLSQVLSFALVQQGLEPLHATTVVVGDRAVGFLGDCGYGKSSLAAAFLAAGYPLLTDDLLVLKRRGRAFLGFPGIPRIKLFPATARKLLRSSTPGLPMNRGSRKLILPLAAGQSRRAPAPLAALYLLPRPGARSRNGRVMIRRLSPRRAFVALLRNTFNPAVREPERLEQLFRHAAAVAATVPMKRLSLPRKLTALPAVRDAILADLGH